MKPAVLVTRRIPPVGLAMLAEVADIDLYQGDAPIPREELLARARGKTAILSLLTDRVDAAVMDAAPQLRIIANYAVGL